MHSQWSAASREVITSRSKTIFQLQTKNIGQNQREFNNLHIYIKHMCDYLMVGSVLLFHKDMSKNRNAKLEGRMMRVEL